MGWRIAGRDRFSPNEPVYPLAGEWDTEEEAILAACERLAYLEMTQPSNQSGGQGTAGIQDAVYIVNPEGVLRRFTGV